MEKPTVLVFTTSYYPYIGGAEIAIQEVTKRSHDSFNFLILTSRFSRALPRQEQYAGAKIIRLGFGTRLDKWLFPIFGFVAGWTILRRSRAATLLWGMDISLGSLVAAFLRFFFPANLFVFTIQYGYGEHKIRRGRFGLIGLAFRIMLSTADSITGISTYLLDLARRFGYAGETHLIHNGVDIENFKIKSEGVRIESKKSKIIITTSRLVPKNGIDVLIEAVAEIKKQIPDIRCHILGDGPERRNLESLTARYSLQTNIKFFGSIPYEKLPQYLHQADVFVRPSRTEGMGNSFVEALAAGLPIIGTPVEGILDIIMDGKTGLFARVDDPGDFAEKIITLISRPDFARDIVREGEKMVAERFDWNKIAVHYGRVFATSMKEPAFSIVLATPLFPPQLGGPALYAANLSREFKNAGYTTQIVSFGDFLALPKIIRYIRYFLRLLGAAFSSDIVFALDASSVGVPAVLVSVLTGKKLFLRFEGDRVWEHFIERTRSDVTLSGFYRTVQPLTRKEKIMWKLARVAIWRAAVVVFSSEWRREMVEKRFGLVRAKTALIRNVIETSRVLPHNDKRNKIILWAGRMLYLKNLYRLVRAFAKANSGLYELHIRGEGPERAALEKYVKEKNIQSVKILPPLPHADLLRAFSSSAVFVLPSVSDVGPNVIGDAITTQTPFIMTRESGYAEYFCNVGICVDPLREDEIEDALRKLMTESMAAERRKKLEGMALQRTWQDAASEWLLLFKLRANR